MNKGSVEDRLEIRELVDTFAVGAMRVDLDIISSVWTDDGHWSLPSMPEPQDGKDAILAYFTKVMAYVDFMSMICFPSDVVVDGDTATGKAYCRELIYPKEGEQLVVIGCYHDEFVKVDGSWRFKKRVYEVIGKG